MVLVSNVFSKLECLYRHLNWSFYFLPFKLWENKCPGFECTPGFACPRNHIVTAYFWTLQNIFFSNKYAVIILVSVEGHIRYCQRCRNSSSQNFCCLTSVGTCSHCLSKLCIGVDSVRLFDVPVEQHAVLEKHAQVYANS